MNCRWKIRRITHSNRGTAYRTLFYDVWDPDGNWSGAFETWAAAMRWATNPVARLEDWLANQPRPSSGYWGQPSDRDDQGRKR